MLIGCRVLVCGLLIGYRFRVSSGLFAACLADLVLVLGRLVLLRVLFVFLCFGGCLLFGCCLCLRVGGCLFAVARQLRLRLVDSFYVLDC